MELTEEEKGVLMFAARDSIRSIFEEIPKPIINYKFYPHLEERGAGAFVTLTIKDNLRGCIGYI
ncbi:MAG TPA: AMMECR1 domain-containing protein, partial [Ignavibacteria bacterium]|nr:AMMECR1 domain-containing protein [Ignavibacteria bacterium]